MIYQYKCTNIKCKEKYKEIDITLPMNRSSKTQYCKECGEHLQRVFGSPGIKTGDGIK